MSEKYSEQAVIGSLIVDESSLDEIIDFIREDDFYIVFHRMVYRAICDMVCSSKKVDLVSLSAYLAEKGENEKEVFVDLCEITKGPFTFKNIKLYAEIVKQKSLDRKMIRISHEVIKSVNDQEENRLDNAQRSFAEISESLNYEIKRSYETMGKVIESIGERFENGGRITGVSTGFLDLDKITHGFHRGDLIIVAGRPSMGKTLLAMNIADNVSVVQKKSVAVFSLEMSESQLQERSISRFSNVKSDSIRSGNLKQEELDKIVGSTGLFNDANLFICDKSLIGVSEIRSRCRKIKREHGLDMVIVDYITLMSGDGENETIRVGNISRGLKAIARDLDVPVVAISQLNRSVEHRNVKKPCMADLRQSGSIEQDADLILMVYREEIYDENTEMKGIAEIIIGKHRSGKVGSIYLTFNGDYCRFDNCAVIPIRSNSNNKDTKKWSGGFEY